MLRVVKGGGSRSRFTENKTVLSLFTKDKDIMKITVHGKLNIYFSFQGFCKITLHSYQLEIMIHKEKLAISQGKKSRSRVMKIPFTTLSVNVGLGGGVGGQFPRNI